MNPALTPHEQQLLIILNAIETRPLAITDLWERLQDAQCILPMDSMYRLVADLETEGRVRTWLVSFEHSLRAVEITRIGLNRLRELRDRQSGGMGEQPDELGGCTKARSGWTCTRQAGHEGPCAAVPTAAEAAADFVAHNFPEATQVTMCNAAEVPADDDEPRTMFCLTGVAADAWWHSLSIEEKADAMVGYYESRALADESLGEITEAGKAALRA